MRQEFKIKVKGYKEVAVKLHNTLNKTAVYCADTTKENGTRPFAVFVYFKLDNSVSVKVVNPKTGVTVEPEKTSYNFIS